MLFNSFLPIFVSSLIFFSLIMEIAEILPNLFRYISNETPISVILRITALYIPKSILYSIPIALLFSGCYTLGQFYSRNELVAVFNSGISLNWFVFPVFLVSIMLSIGMFFIEEKIAIPFLQEKNNLHRDALNITISLSDSNVAVTNTEGNIIYHADIYNDEDERLSSVVVLVLNFNLGIEKRLDAEEAFWDGEKWVFTKVRLFTWKSGIMTEGFFDQYSETLFTEEPATFRRVNRDVNEMTFLDAFDWANTLRTAGREYRVSLTNTYNKLSLPLTPLIVALIASAAGGLLRKNILLLSLILSLGITVMFFSVRLICNVLAKSGFIPPAVGAFGAVLLFLLIGFILFRFART